MSQLSTQQDVILQFDFHHSWLASGFACKLMSENWCLTTEKYDAGKVKNPCKPAKQFM